MRRTNYDFCNYHRRDNLCRSYYWAWDIWAHRQSQNTGEDYFLARRSVSWLHLVLTMFATWMSTFAFNRNDGDSIEFARQQQLFHTLV